MYIFHVVEQNGINHRPYFGHLTQRKNKNLPLLDEGAKSAKMLTDFWVIGQRTTTTITLYGTDKRQVSVLSFNSTKYIYQYVKIYIQGLSMIFDSNDIFPL